MTLSIPQTVIIPVNPVQERQFVYNPTTLRNGVLAAGGYRQAVNRQGNRTVVPHYPYNWDAAKKLVNQRCQGRCEVPGCSTYQGMLRWSTRTDINGITTMEAKIETSMQIAHLTPDPRNIEPNQLMAMCGYHHGKRDLRDHQGTGAVTSAMAGTLRKRRALKLLKSMKQSARDTGALEVGEVEFLLAITVSKERLVSLPKAATLITGMVGVKLDQIALTERLVIVGEKLCLRGLATVTGKGQLRYALKNSLWDEYEQPTPLEQLLDRVDDDRARAAAVIHFLYPGVLLTQASDDQLREGIKMVNAGAEFMGVEPLRVIKYNGHPLPLPPQPNPMSPSYSTTLQAN